jgi:hypothetical protein
MKKEEQIYFYLILIHVFIGMLIFALPFLAKVYGYSIFLFGIYVVIKLQNRNDECLLVAGYVVGSEILLRMTGGNITYEFSKYEVMIFLFLGMYYKGFSRGAIPYWLFLLLLVPGVVMTGFVLDYDSDIRRAIAFNISGPVCLAFSSLYTYRRKMSLEQINNILLCIGLPIISCTVYLIFYTPNIRDIITGTASNYETSGGFGPNQVATFLGLGMFIFFSRIILESRSKILLVINLVIAANITYRGMVTFSRGGMITGFLMIVLLLSFLYLKSNYKGKVKLNYIFSVIVIAMVVIWGYTSYQTGGLINKRYANQDAAGRAKKSQFTGREDIAKNEIDIFFEYPIWSRCR